MTIRLEFPTSQQACDACGTVSELSQALRIGAVQHVELMGKQAVISLRVPDNFDRAPILAMFAGVERYILDRAGLDALAAEVKR